MRTANVIATAVFSPTTKQRVTALKEVVAIAFLSLLPPDRVGVTRRLRFGHTLKKKADGNYRLDLSLRKDGHKTSRHYGPYCTASAHTSAKPWARARAAMRSRRCP